jgi:prevent-host-death family protein
MHAWQMQEAEAQLLEVIKCAESEGPQNITLHGQIVAVMVSKSMFERLTGKEHSLVDFMRESPLYGLDEISLDRDASLTREVSQGNVIEPHEYGV